MARFRELTKDEQERLRKACWDSFQEKYAFDRFDEDNPVDDEDDPAYEDYRQWYREKVAVEDAASLQDFADANLISVGDHIESFDVDSVIPRETLEAFKNESDPVAEAEIDRIFQEHYGLTISLY